MKTLISFAVTQPYNILKKKGISPLAVLDDVTGEVFWIKLPESIHCHGMTGLAQNESYIFTLYHAKKFGILVFDKKSFELIHQTELAEILDPHSLYIHKNMLYIVSSGNDQVFSYQLIDGYRVDASSAKIVWKPKASAGVTDSHHLNAITGKSNNIYISGFGPKKGELHSSASNGYIHNIMTNKPMLTRIFHPHSLSLTGDTFLYCESATGSVFKNKQKLIRIKQGYIRGLYQKNGFLVVATSSARQKSKSTGIVTHRFDEGLLQRSCRVLFFNDSFLPLPTKFSSKIAPKLVEQTYLFDFSLFFNEIYDLLPITINKQKIKTNLVSVSHFKKQTAADLIDLMEPLKFAGKQVSMKKIKETSLFLDSRVNELRDKMNTFTYTANKSTKALFEEQMRTEIIDQQIKIDQLRTELNRVYRAKVFSRLSVFKKPILNLKLRLKTYLFKPNR